MDNYFNDISWDICYYWSGKIIIISLIGNVFIHESSLFLLAQSGTAPECKDFAEDGIQTMGQYGHCGLLHGTWDFRKKILLFNKKLDMLGVWYFVTLDNGYCLNMYNAI